MVVCVILCSYFYPIHMGYTVYNEEYKDTKNAKKNCYKNDVPL